MKTDPAYLARLQARLERVPEDVAWAHRGPDVILALMLAEERRRDDLPSRLMADALLMCEAGMLQVQR